MERNTILLLIGVLLVITAIIIYGVSASIGTEDVKTYEIPQGEERVDWINITQEGNYTLIASFVGNVSYTLYSENGTVVESGANKTYVEINITQEGRYTFRMRNLGEEKAKATVIFAENQKLIKGLYVIYISGGICCGGIILVIIAILLLLLKRKKEEKFYSRP